MGRGSIIERAAAFAFRTIVDNAIEPLSPAVNGPTIAVIAIDPLHRLLRAVGRRRLHDDMIRNATAVARVVFQPPVGRISCASVAEKLGSAVRRTADTPDFQGLGRAYQKLAA